MRFANTQTLMILNWRGRFRNLFISVLLFKLLNVVLIDEGNVRKVVFTYVSELMIVGKSSNAVLSHLGCVNGNSGIDTASFNGIDNRLGVIISKDTHFSYHIKVNHSLIGADCAELIKAHDNIGNLLPKEYIPDGVLLR